MDALEFLTTDHRHVEMLFREFSEEHDMTVATEVCLALTLHARVEELHLYPLLAEHDQGTADACETDHRAMRDFIARIQGGSGGIETVAYMGQLRDEVAKHVEYEEAHVFPLLRTVVEPANLAAIGVEMKAAHAAVS